eukprot:2587785-Rhodomonas_salina.1
MPSVDGTVPSEETEVPSRPAVAAATCSASLSAGGASAIGSCGASTGDWRGVGSGEGSADAGSARIRRLLLSRASSAAGGFVEGLSAASGD